MILIKTNIGAFVSLTRDQLAKLADTDKMLRTCAITTLALMKKRIHEDGLDALGNRIGTYSPGYMKIRTGDFLNASRVTKGKNKGKLKDAGVFTDRTIRLDKKTGVFSGEDKVGKARTRYNRTSDTKTVLSLTREMENDIKVVAVKTGTYGIGYSNKHNYDKSQWCEATYKRKGKIFILSDGEITVVSAIADKHKADAFS